MGGAAVSRGGEDSDQAVRELLPKYEKEEAEVLRAELVDFLKSRSAAPRSRKRSGIRSRRSCSPGHQSEVSGSVARCRHRVAQAGTGEGRVGSRDERTQRRPRRDSRRCAEAHALRSGGCAVQCIHERATRRAPPTEVNKSCPHVLFPLFTVTRSFRVRAIALPARRSRPPSRRTTSPLHPSPSRSPCALQHGRSHVAGARLAA